MAIMIAGGETGSTAAVKDEPESSRGSSGGSSVSVADGLIAAEAAEVSGGETRSVPAEESFIAKHAQFFKDVGHVCFPVDQEQVGAVAVDGGVGDRVVDGEVAVRAEDGGVAVKGNGERTYNNLHNKTKIIESAGEKIVLQNCTNTKVIILEHLSGQITM